MIWPSIITHHTPDIDEFSAAFRGEKDLFTFLEAQRPELMAVDAAGFTQAMSSILPEVDKQTLLEDPEVGTCTVASLQEGLRNGVEGWDDDDLAFIKPWGFDLAEVKVPVFLYQGSEDKMVLFAHRKWVMGHLPQEHLRAHLMDGKGRISIFWNNLENDVKELVDVVHK
jgi:pimeloyl-ACP methyl ester carboxylesterase